MAPPVNPTPAKETSRQDVFRVEIRKSRLKTALVISLLGACAVELKPETMTLTTYYPSPVGIYKKLTTTLETILARDGGNVGVGTGKPVSKLDVRGGVRAGDQTVATTCGVTTGGTMRYNTVAKRMEYCNESMWVPIGVGDAKTFIGKTSASYSAAQIGSYAAFDALCAAQYGEGARGCVSFDFVRGVPTETGWFNTYAFAWVTDFGAAVNDCFGWNNSVGGSGHMGALWWASPGGFSTVNFCWASYPLLCCK